MATTKLRSIWSASIGEQVLSQSKSTYGLRGEITAFLGGGRAEVRLNNGSTVIIPLPDLELL